MSDGRYKVKWATGVEHRDRVTTVTAAEIRRKEQTPPAAR